MVDPLHFGELRQPLGLPPGFDFQTFRKVTPLDGSTIWALLLERNQQRITVKRPDKAQDNLRRLIEATFRLANQVGFVSMTLRDLCRETELSMGGLYGYIASKDDLAAMIEDMIRFLGAAIPHWFDDQPSPTARLDAFLRGHVFLSELLQPWFYFVFMESRMLSGSQRQVAKAAELQLQQDLASRIADAGVPDPAEAQLLAAHTAALIQDWHVKRWKFRQQKVSADTFAASVSRFVLQRVQPFASAAGLPAATPLPDAAG